MGRRGPPPKPSALKKLEGTYRPDRAARNEVTAPPGAPERPSWLDAEGKREWDRVVPVLVELGVLAEVDASVLANYCAAHSLAIKATKRYQREGVLLKTNGAYQRHPMVKVAQDARAQARLLGAELGLSPASRSRISGPGDGKPKPSGEEEKSEKFLFGKPRLVKGGPDGQ